LTPAEVNLGIECGLGRSAGVQAGYQVALIACSFGFSLIGGSIAGKCVAFTTELIIRVGN